MRAAAVVVYVATAIVLGAFLGLWAASVTRPTAPEPQPAPNTVRSLQLSPCPSWAPSPARRPDGAYVCVYTVPADSGQGPTIAPRRR